MTVATLAWAMEARGLSPPAKLILILVGDHCDMDGRAFDLEDVAAQANVTPDYMDELIQELAKAGLAVKRQAFNQGTGESAPCVELLCEPGVLEL